jgi:hypothetical protein
LQRTRSCTPDLETLTAVLRTLLIENGPHKGELKIVHRELAGQGTFPKEIVTCSLGDGKKFRLFCKYEMGYNHNAYGHRGGVAHEARVYEQLLQPLEVSTPWLYGVYEDASSGYVWLVLDFLEESVRVQKSLDTRAMGLAARWLGQFQALCQERMRTTSMPFLQRYDEEYYLAWARRTLQFFDRHQQPMSWLQQLCARFHEEVSALLSVPPTVIHGEYYPKNILYCDGTIYPVDWESTALAAGEIDLASLTEAWPEAIARECEAQYKAARWPDDSPDDFERRLGAARLYLHFRWLGVSPESSVDEWRLSALHATGRQLGLI